MAHSIEEWKLRAETPRWSADGRQAVGPFVALKSLSKFAKGGNKIIAIFHQGDTSRFHKSKFNRRFLQMQHGCK